MDDLVRKPLDKCRSTPQERPPIIEVYRTLRYRPRATHTLWGSPTIGMLKLHVRGLKSWGVGNLLPKGQVQVQKQRPHYFLGEIWNLEANVHGLRFAHFNSRHRR